MLSRDVLRKCFAVILPVFVLIGSFLMVKISSQIDAEAACNGRVPNDGQETPGVQDYCPDQTDVNYTWESAYFFPGHLPDRPELVQKWNRDQSWAYDDDVYCTTDVEKNIPREDWDGWWAGSESKSREWNSDIEEWVIYIYSHTLTFSAEKINGEDFICPTWHQTLGVYEVCGTGLWPDYDLNVDFSESVIGNGVQRQGEDSGLPFSCYSYPSDISF